MAENSKISWTDHTFNPWLGCSKVHAGCTHCYAEAFNKRTGKAKWGDQGTRIKTSEANWKKPLTWNRQAEAAGERQRVFCASLADVFEDWQGPILHHAGRRLACCHRVCGYQAIDELPVDGARWVTMDDLRADLFELIDVTPMLDWLLLTKRPENVPRMWPAKDDVRPIFPGAPGDLGKAMPCKVTGAMRANVWLGTSISDQATANKFAPALLKNRKLAPVLFLSVEPLLGEVRLNQLEEQHGDPYNDPGRECHTTINDCLTGFRAHKCGGYTDEAFRIDWLIVGGESGARHRPMDLDWARSLRDQCKAAGVPLFFKQAGGRFPGTGEELDGAIIHEFPRQLQSSIETGK